MSKKILGPLADAYEPTDADAERVLAKITGALAPPPPPAPPRTGGFGKYVVGGVAAIALVTAFALRRPAEATSPPSPTMQPAPVVTAAQVPVEAPALPAISVDSLPTVAAPAPKPAPSASPDDTLAREARLLAEARRATASGDNTRALTLLDEHARTFPNGFLASDRAAEHIVVLCSLGRKSEATAEAQTFLAGRAPSPLTRRVSQSCAGEP